MAGRLFSECCDGTRSCSWAVTGQSRPAETERKRQRDKWEAKIMMESNEEAEKKKYSEARKTILTWLMTEMVVACFLMTQIGHFTLNVDCVEPNTLVSNWQTWNKKYQEWDCKKHKVSTVLPKKSLHSGEGTVWMQTWVVRIGKRQKEQGLWVKEGLKEYFTN